jgi:outer membrane protein TolC
LGAKETFNSGDQKVVIDTGHTAEVGEGKMERHVNRALMSLSLVSLFIVLIGCSTTPSEKTQAKLAEKDPLWDYQQIASDNQTQPPIELNDNSTLEDYLAYAALNNPGLKSAFLKWKAALEKIPQVKSLPDPRFTYGYFIQEVETRVGPQRHKFGLSQVFPWFGKLKLRGTAAGEAAQAERERYEAAKLKLFYNVKEPYYEYEYLGHAIAVTEENLKLVQNLENIAQTWYAVGSASHADLVRAQVELGKLEDRLRTLIEMREPIVAKLNAALNNPPDTSLPWPQKTEKEEVFLTEEGLLTWIKENNPELKAVESMASKEKVNMDLARKNYFPDMRLGIDTIETGEALQPDTPDSGKDPVILSFSINLPIWWNKYKAGEREALARYKGFLEERTNRENRLIAEVKWALYKYQDAERKIDLYQNALIPKAEQSFSVTLQSYQTGEGTFSDLIDTVRTLLEFQLSYERAVADRVQRLAELEMLVGKEFPRTPKEENGPDEKKTPQNVKKEN